MQRWFDGHLDLAYLAENGRDLTQPAETCGGGLQPASVTFPTLQRGAVAAALGTLFIQKRTASDSGPWCFSTPDEAHAAALRQVAIYEGWHRANYLQLLNRPDLPPSTGLLQVVLLMEGASGVRAVEEFATFYRAGVRVVSLTWAEGSPWSGGDQTGGDLTPAGHALVREIDRLGCIHDLSHLSERAFWSVMATACGPRVASHSNCRDLLPGKKHPERHLSNEQIRAIADAGGLIGINLFDKFLVSAPMPDPVPRSTIADILRHVGHMEQVAGRRDFIALGSDMDGGFGRQLQPADLDGPEHLHRLAEALAASGWSDSEIDRFAWGNWVALLRRVGIRVA